MLMFSNKKLGNAQVKVECRILLHICVMGIFNSMRLAEIHVYEVCSKRYIFKSVIT